MNQWYLIYDDKCAVCNAGVSRIKSLDRSGLVRLVPISNLKVLDGLELPSKESMHEAMHLIAPDKTVYKGADAVARVAEIFPKSKLAGKFISLPIIRNIARLIYGIVARNRMRLSKIVS